MPMVNDGQARFRLGWGLLGIVGLVLQAISTNITVPGYFSHPINVVNFFSYFTILVNIVVTLWFLLAFQAMQTKQVHWWGYQPRIKGAIITAGTVVILVYWTLLVSIPIPNVPGEIANFLLHLLVPAGMWIDWIIARDAIPQGFWQMVPAWLVFPVAFGIYSVIRGQFVNWYPYYFLDPSVVGGIGNQFLAIAGITVIFLVVASIVYWLYQKWGGFTAPAATSRAS
jgi:hypothetical protein